MAATHSSTTRLILLVVLYCIAGSMVCKAQSPTVQVLQYPPQTPPATTPFWLFGNVISAIRPTYFWTASVEAFQSTIRITQYTRPDTSSVYQPGSTAAIRYLPQVPGSNTDLLVPFCVSDQDINTANIYYGYTGTSGHGVACMTTYSAPTFIFRPCLPDPFGTTESIVFPTSILCLPDANKVWVSGVQTSLSGPVFVFSAFPNAVWTSGTNPSSAIVTQMSYTSTAQMPVAATTQTSLLIYQQAAQTFCIYDPATNNNPCHQFTSFVTTQFWNLIATSDNRYFSLLISGGGLSGLGLLYSAGTSVYDLVNNNIGLTAVTGSSSQSGSIGAYAYPCFNGNTFMDSMFVIESTTENPTKAFILTRPNVGSSFSTASSVNLTIPSTIPSPRYLGYTPTSIDIYDGTPNEVILGAPGAGSNSNPYIHGNIMQVSGLTGFCNQYPAPPVSPPVAPPVSPPVAPPPVTIGSNYNLTIQPVGPAGCYYTGSVLYATDPLSVWTICAANAITVNMMQFTRSITSQAPLVLANTYSDNSYGGPLSYWPINANLPPPFHTLYADGVTHLFTGYPTTGDMDLHYSVIISGYYTAAVGVAFGNRSIYSFWPTMITGPTNNETQFYVAGKKLDGTIQFERWILFEYAYPTITHVLTTSGVNTSATTYIYPFCATNQAFYYQSGPSTISVFNYTTLTVTTTINITTLGTFRDIVVSNNDGFLVVIGQGSTNASGTLWNMGYTPLPLTNWTTTSFTANTSTDTANNYINAYICNNGNPTADSIMVTNSNAGDPAQLYLLWRNNSDSNSQFSFSGPDVQVITTTIQNTTTLGLPLLGKTLSSHLVNSITQEMFVGAPGNGTTNIYGGGTGGPGYILQLQFTNFCMPYVPPVPPPVSPPIVPPPVAAPPVLPPVTPPVTPPPNYYLTLTRPPVDAAGYTQFGLALAATSNGGGIAVVSRRNDSNQALITVYKRTSPGAYVILNPSLIPGPDIMNLTIVTAPQILATVRLSDDLNRLAISSTLTGQPVMYFYYNNALGQFVNFQNSTGTNSTQNVGTGMDMTRDGRAVAYTQDNATIVLRLFSGQNTNSSSPYQFVQNIPAANDTAGNVALVSLDAYGRTLVTAGPTAASGVRAWVYQVLSQFDPYQQGLFTFQAEIATPPIIYIYSLRLIGNGTQVWANGLSFQDTIVDAVLFSQYDPVMDSWGDWNVTNMRGSSAISVSDYGAGVAIIDETRGSSALYSFYLSTDSDTTWQYILTVPYPPWDVAQAGVQYIGQSNTDGLTADCTMLIVSHFIYQITTPPSGDGNIVLYLTDETCTVTPFLPPFAPLPPPVTPTPQVSPIKQAPASPFISPKYAPFGSPIVTPTEGEAADPTEVASLAVASLTLVVALITLICVVSRNCGGKGSRIKKHEKGRPANAN